MGTSVTETDGKRRILLVDDDASMLKVFSRRLEHAGYEVLKAVDGEEALTKVREQPPDLIVLDIMMPKLNGYEVCTRLKQDQTTSHIPIIMFTAKGRPQEHLAGLMLGASAYISKSCQASELLDQIHRLLSNSST